MKFELLTDEWVTIFHTIMIIVIGATIFVGLQTCQKHDALENENKKIELELLKNKK